MPQIQSLFLAVIDVGLTGSSRISELALALRCLSYKKQAAKSILEGWLTGQIQNFEVCLMLGRLL